MGFGCSSLETLPDQLKPNSSLEPILALSKCSKLADNQGFIDLFFAMIKKSPQVSLSLSLVVLSILLCMFQVLCLTYEDDIYIMLFLGSEIPEWFSHQCIGDEVNIMEPFSHLCNDGIGIAFCVVFCTLPSHPIQYYSPISCELAVNGKYFNYVSGEMVALSDHITLLYFLPQLWECDANGFYEIGIKIEDTPTSLVKKCGLRVVYKKDIEDLNSAMAQCSNNGIIPYKGFDVSHHNFINSAVVVEVNKNDCEESS